MPYDPVAPRLDHLRLFREEINPPRRKHKAPPPPPSRGNRITFGTALTSKIAAIEQQASAKLPPAPGVQPHLVFRVPLAKGGSLEVVRQRLEECGLTIVSMEQQDAVIAFREDADLRDFRAAVAAYQRGPRAGINAATGKPYASTRWDVLQFIEAGQMRALDATDRIGPRLASKIGPAGAAIDDAATYILDVELWHRGDKLLTRSDLTDLQKVILQPPANQVGRILDQFVGQWVCLARISVKGLRLRQLLSLDIIAEIELPPIPLLDAFVAARATKRDFPTPPKPAADAPRVCILDSGITAGHPLLANNVGHEEAILTTQTTAADAHGHGTMVGGLAVFGNIRACYERGIFASPVMLFSARLLNDQNEFDDDKLLLTQIATAIDTFMKPPHNCRVFNISIGTPAPAIDPAHPRQTQWAEGLDIIARENKVLIVLAAGNNAASFSTDPTKAEQIFKSYPKLLMAPEAKLCDPATAAIPITVGAIAEYDEPAVRPGVAANNVVRPLARSDQPSSFTRIGPGVDGAIKPELVEYGGNVLFDGAATLHAINPARPDAGVAVMSFSNTPTTEMFAFNVGTSLAAPRVSYAAAQLWNRLRRLLGHEPDPNLVRALLALSAAVPENAKALIASNFNDNHVCTVCGYGRIDLDFALESTNQRVNLISYGSMEIDTFSIFEVPIPPEMIAAQGDKFIDVALAFDPPVRRRRAEYLGVVMSFDMIRGKNLSQVIDAYRAAESGENPDKAISGSSRIGFFPSTACRNEKFERNASTLQKGTFRFNRTNKNFGESYFLVVRAQRRWAPQSITHQDFAVAVNLRAQTDQLYNRVHDRIALRVRQREQQRQRARG